MMRLPARLPVLLLMLAAIAVAGCASAPIKNQDPRDPWERMNRSIWGFDMGFVHKVALPVGHTYIRVVPHEIRTGIGNLFDNADYPQVFVNDLLQAKFRTGLSDIGRFLVNSTVGIGGLFDPAARVGLPKNSNDFGRTLGTWGAPPGPYLVLPFLGMSDVRDTAGRIPDGFLEPQNYINDIWIYIGVYTVYALDTDARTLMPLYTLLESQHAFDEYAFARNAYLQQRAFRIHGASQKSEEEQEEELQRSLQDPAADDSTPPK
ncbi:MAG TPA: VacJ family lipoprotein [Steroidobacteraceae bacterium]|nr:VacJ family lipoprotein [Steroidobacteraceae bacterium]